MVQFSDLLGQATKLGFHWNEAHDILVKDRIPPMYETNSLDYYKCDLDQNAYGWSDATVKIMRSFFEEYSLTEFTLIRD